MCSIRTMGSMKYRTSFVLCTRFFRNRPTTCAASRAHKPRAAPWPCPPVYITTSTSLHRRRQLRFGLQVVPAGRAEVAARDGVAARRAEGAESLANGRALRHRLRGRHHLLLPLVSGRLGGAGRRPPASLDEEEDADDEDEAAADAAADGRDGELAGRRRRLAPGGAARRGEGAWRSEGGR